MCTPLVSVLRLVDDDSKLATPYIYEAMNRDKEQIAINLDNEEMYNKVWKIIDTRWNLQLHRPLHVVAYFLNPKQVALNIKIYLLFDFLLKFILDFVY